MRRAVILLLIPFSGPNIWKLQGYIPETWRYRTGPSRIFSAVGRDERIVFLLTVEDREDAYR